jgi:hypothetical protein
MKLSNYQAKLVSKLRKENRFLWHNEGRNFRAWIGDEKGEVIEYIRRDSAESLAKKKTIKLIDGDHPIRLYKHGLRRDKHE